VKRKGIDKREGKRNGERRKGRKISRGGEIWWGFAFFPSYFGGTREKIV
jgi:hypothetical protein